MHVSRALCRAATPSNLMVERIATREQITRLKERREKLLSTSCTPLERRRLLKQVRHINRKIRTLRQRLGWREGP